MRAALVIGLLLALAAPAGAATATPDRAGSVSAGSPSFSWQGATAEGHHLYWTEPVAFDPSKCSKDPATYCDVSLVRLDAAAGSTATLTFALSEFTSPAADFDVYVYRSDAAATIGELTKASGCCQPAGMDENVVLSDAEPGYYLVFVPYWFVPQPASYKGTVTGADIIAAAPAAPSASPPAPASSPAAASPPVFRLGRVRVGRNRRVVSVRVEAGEEVRGLTVLLRSGRRVLGRARVAVLPAGSRPVIIQMRRAIAPGTYRVSATAKVRGGPIRASRRVRLRGR